jgi:hypothetical protein
MVSMFGMAPQKLPPHEDILNLGSEFFRALVHGRRAPEEYAKYYAEANHPFYNQHDVHIVMMMVFVLLSLVLLLRKTAGGRAKAAFEVMTFSVLVGGGIHLVWLPLARSFAAWGGDDVVENVAAQLLVKPFVDYVWSLLMGGWVSMPPDLKFWLLLDVSWRAARFMSDDGRKQFRFLSVISSSLWFGICWWYPYVSGRQQLITLGVACDHILRLADAATNLQACQAAWTKGDKKD